MNNKNVITKKDLWKVTFRHYFMNSTYNYNSGQASGIVYELYPALRKIYKNDNDLEKSIDNHFKYYNCHPWLSAIITGATLAMEEKDGLESLEAVQNLKVGLMGPFSGVGDTIIWVMLPTILGSIAGSMGKQGSPIGMYIFLLTYFVLFILRSYLYFIGYNSGTKLVTELGNKLSAFTDAVSVLGIMIVGSIIPTTINFKLAYSFSQAGVKLSGQQILDQLMPALLPVCLVSLLFFLLKKGFKMTSLIWIVIAIAMAGAGLGIFTV